MACTLYERDDWSSYDNDCKIKSIKVDQDRSFNLYIKHPATNVAWLQHACVCASLGYVDS